MRFPSALGKSRGLGIGFAGRGFGVLLWCVLGEVNEEASFFVVK
jgi:hypothetical protein